MCGCSICTCKAYILAYASCMTYLIRDIVRKAVHCQHADSPHDAVLYPANIRGGGGSGSGGSLLASGEAGLALPLRCHPACRLVWQMHLCL